MSTTYRTTLTGAFPRPESLVQATRDLDRGRIGPAAAEAAYVAAERSVREVEERLRLDSRTGGYLRWQDMFRPFFRCWTGLKEGPLTRYFETNTFFRRPTLEAAPAPGGPDALAAWLPRGPASRAILPGPFTFAALADVRYGSERPGGPVEDIAAALASSLRALGPDRPAQVQFQEPMLAYEPPTKQAEAIEAAYRTLAAACAGARTSIWTFFGDGAPVLELAARLPVDAIGIDLAESELEGARSLAGKALGLGCIDPTTTLPEDPTELTRLIRAAEAAVRPAEVWLGPSPPLDLLPFDAAVAKLDVLPRLQGALRS